MPIPVTARQGPTMVQQLDEILSSADQIPVVGVEQLVDPFVYRPVERGQRARSESPGSFSLPIRPVTVPLPGPLVVPSATYSGARTQRPSCRPFSRRETTSEEDIDPASQTSTAASRWHSCTSSRHGSMAIIATSHQTQYSNTRPCHCKLINGPKRRVWAIRTVFAPNNDNRA